MYVALHYMAQRHGGVDVFGELQNLALEENEEE
jgi:hypothetical protein